MRTFRNIVFAPQEWNYINFFAFRFEESVFTVWNSCQLMFIDCEWIWKFSGQNEQIICNTQG